MGISNPTSNLLNYKIDNEVGASLSSKEIDGVNYVQLVSKNNKVLGQLPMDPAAHPSVLQEELTANITVGGIEAGTVFDKGTSLEDILRQLLRKPTVSYYVGFTTDLSRAATLELTDKELLSYVVGEFDKTLRDKYTYTFENEKGVFFILLKEGELIDNAIFTPQGTAILSTYWNNDTFTSIDSTWFMGTDNESRKVVINNETFILYGLYNNTWTIAENSPTGVADQVIVSIVL